MKGIDYVLDDSGKRKAVIIDLLLWGDVWEDLYDVLVSKSRRDEPTVSWQILKAEIDPETARRA